MYFYTEFENYVILHRFLKTMYFLHWILKQCIYPSAKSFSTITCFQNNLVQLNCKNVSCINSMYEVRLS